MAKSVGLTFATSMLSSAATAAAALVVARTLGARGAGVFTLARVVPTVVSGLLGAGITVANPYFVSGRKFSVQAITETSLALGLAVGIVGWAAWAAATPLLTARTFRLLPPATVVVLGLAIPILIVRNYLNSIQQGLQAFPAANLALFAEDLGAMLFVVPLLWRTAGAENEATIVLAPLAGAAASLLVTVGDLRRRGIVLRPRLRRVLARRLLVFGLKGHLARIANTLSWRLDTILLSAFTTPEAVGYYAVATKIAEVVRPLSGSLNFVLRPLIASLSDARARTEGVRLFRVFFPINLAAVAVMWAVCGWIIVGLFGPAFEAAVPACRILLLGLVAFGADGVLNGYNVGIGRPELNAYAALIGVVITAAGDVALIPSYGVTGAAVTSAIAYTAKAVALVAIFLAVSRVTLPELVGWRTETRRAA